VLIGGLMEHIEPAGIHSGDSACALPSVSLSKESLATIRQWSKDLALALEVRGLINLQFAVQREKVFIIEANPRASRTVPFVAKATGVPLAKIASQLMAGRTLVELGLTSRAGSPAADGEGGGASLQAIPRFRQPAGAGNALHRRSDGHRTPPSAWPMPRRRSPPVTPCPRPAPCSSPPMTGTSPTWCRWPAAGGSGLCPGGLRGHGGGPGAEGLAVETVLKVHEGRPNIEDSIRSGEIQLVINTPVGRQAAHDDRYLRRAALDYAVPTVTTLAGARAAVEAIAALQQSHQMEVAALQDIHVPWGTWELRDQAALGSPAWKEQITLEQPYAEEAKLK
jgi:carbamoyl-phosphate synthase large subunit